MTEDEEPHWIEGNKAAYRAIFSECSRHLPDIKDEARRLSERAETIALLRQVCGEHGDNEWDDNLHLADIIAKHLWNHLESEPED